MESEERILKFDGNDDDENVISHIFVFVPKRFAQKTREFLLAENRFLKWKGFMKLDTNEIHQDTLGISTIPVQSAQTITNINDTVEQSVEIRQEAVILRQKLALHLDVSLESIQIKQIHAGHQGNTQRTNKGAGENKVASPKRTYLNTFERLKSACLQVQTEWALDDYTKIICNVPKHWEIHTNLVLFPPNAFKNVLAHGDQPVEIIQQRREGLWKEICDVLSVKRIAIKNPGGIQNDDFRSPSVMLMYGFRMKNEKTENGNCDQGSFNTWAERIENGIIQTWDITQCMFSVGNVSEKLRVAKFNCEHEAVLDLFAGIGYFVLPYLIHAKAKHVFACEWNPAAIRALKRNLHLNNIQESRYTIIQGDNRLLCPKNVADRVNLGLIPSAEGSYRAAVNALKDKTGGILHIHANVRRAKVINIRCDNETSKSDIASSVTQTEKPNDGVLFQTDPSVGECKYTEWKSWAIETAQKIAMLLKEKDRNCFWKLSLLRVEHVKTFAPFVDHLVLDLHCTSTLEALR